MRNLYSEALTPFKCVGLSHIYFQQAKLYYQVQAGPGTSEEAESVLGEVGGAHSSSGQESSPVS